MERGRLGGTCIVVCASCRVALRLERRVGLRAVEFGYGAVFVGCGRGRGVGGVRWEEIAIVVDGEVG